MGIVFVNTLCSANRLERRWNSICWLGLTDELRSEPKHVGVWLCGSKFLISLKKPTTDELIEFPFSRTPDWNNNGQRCTRYIQHRTPSLLAPPRVW